MGQRIIENLHSKYYRKMEAEFQILLIKKEI